MDIYGEFDIMSLSIEWHPSAQAIMVGYAQQDRSSAKEVGRAYELIEVGADGGWIEFEQVPASLSQGKSLRFFEVGSLTVILQVLSPVKLRVATIGVGVNAIQFPILVATAVSVV